MGINKQTKIMKNVKLFEEFINEATDEATVVTEARAKYVNTQKTVDGNPLISFNSSNARAKWIDKNKPNVISVPKSTVISSDQGRVVGTSRGPYYLIVKADVLDEDFVNEGDSTKFTWKEIMWSLVDMGMSPDKISDIRRALKHRTKK